VYKLLLAGGWALAVAGGYWLDQYLRVVPLAAFHEQAAEIFDDAENHMIAYQAMMDGPYDRFQKPRMITKDDPQGYLNSLPNEPYPGLLHKLQWKPWDDADPAVGVFCEKWSDIGGPGRSILTWHLPVPGIAKLAGNRPQPGCVGSLEAEFDLRKLFARLFKAATEKGFGVRIDAKGAHKSDPDKINHETPRIFATDGHAEASGPWTKETNIAFHTFSLHIVLSAPRRGWNAEWPGWTFFTLGSVSSWALYRMSRRRDERNLQDRGHQLGLRQRGEDVAFIAHELAQPLTGISGCLEGLLVRSNRGDLPAEILARDLSAAFQLAQRAGDFLEEIRGQVAGQSEGQRRAVAVSEVFRSVAALAGVDSRFHDIALLVKEGGSELRVMAGKAALEMVLLNLLRNSAEAIHDEGRGGTVSLEARVEGDWVKLRVTDDGPGIGQPDALFQPFRSSKDYGTGLGLVHCKRQVERLGGSIEGGNRPEGGAWFEIALPVCGEEPRKAAGRDGQA